MDINMVRDVYESKKKDIIQLMKDKDVMMKFGSKVVDVRCALDALFNDVDKLMAGEYVEVDNETKKLIEKFLDILKEVVIFGRLDERFRYFVLCVCDIVKIWNKFLVMEHRVDLDVGVLERLVLQQMTILDAINVMRKMIEKCNELVEYSSPKFELSRHYIDAMIKSDM